MCWNYPLCEAEDKVLQQQAGTYPQFLDCQATSMFTRDPIIVTLSQAHKSSFLKKYSSRPR